MDVTCGMLREPSDSRGGTSTGIVNVRTSDVSVTPRTCDDGRLGGGGQTGSTMYRRVGIFDHLRDGGSRRSKGIVLAVMHRQAQKQKLSRVKSR